MLFPDVDHQARPRELRLGPLGAPAQPLDLQLLGRGGAGACLRREAVQDRGIPGPPPVDDVGAVQALAPRMEPRVPSVGAASYSARMRALYSAVKVRRTGRSGGVGSPSMAA